MKFKVELARLVRETRVVVVEAESKEELWKQLSEVYDKDDDAGDWTPDNEWGCEPGTHTIIGEFDGVGEYHEVKLPCPNWEAGVTSCDCSYCTERKNA